MIKKPERSIEEIFSEDKRYPLEAVQFVREGLNHSVAKFHADGGESGTVRHVSGAQLCEGLLELALKRWGLMARSVLEKWNIKQTRDFGEIVFLLVNNGWMQKEPSDRLDDFDNVYDFKKAFRQGFDLSLDN
ncbi:MAG: hypothetical protein GY869_30615 [Planctomycetes bacterium]|nr:hypothetical protein [Planctomycetota bacterium]